MGLNTAIVSRSGESAGIGFAIPVNTIRSALPQLIKFGKVLRPQIGIVVRDTNFGPMILQIAAGSPADKAGLQSAHRRVKRGPFVGEVLDENYADFVLGVNGTRVRTRRDMMDQLDKVRSGDQVELLVRRGLNSRALRKVRVQAVLG